MDFSSERARLFTADGAFPKRCYGKITVRPHRPTIVKISPSGSRIEQVIILTRYIIRLSRRKETVINFYPLLFIARRTYIHIYTCMRRVCVTNEIPADLSTIPHYSAEYLLFIRKLSAVLAVPRRGHHVVINRRQERY